MNRTQQRALAADLAEIYANQHTRVLGIVARTLNFSDHAEADDLAQDVWVEAWQYMLRGNEVRSWPGLLGTFARHRVYKHYQLARVRREQVTDPQDAALDRIIAQIQAVA